MTNDTQVNRKLRSISFDFHDFLLEDAELLCEAMQVGCLLDSWATFVQIGELHIDGP